MFSFSSFLRESMIRQPGALMIARTGGMFDSRTVWGVVSDNAVYRILELTYHGSEVVGTPTAETLDLDGMSPEIVLGGLRHGDIIQSYLQLAGLPDGAVIQPSIKSLSKKSFSEYRKVSVLEWIEIGGGPQKFLPVHFAMSLKYQWLR